MNWEAIGAVGEVLGAVGVIVTLVYLAVQIRQNSTLLKQNTRAHATDTYRANVDGVMNLQALLAQDEALGLIWKKGLADEDLSDVEAERFDAYLNMWLFDIENKFVVSQSQGWNQVASDAEVIAHIEGQVRHVLGGGRSRIWWQQNAKRTFSAAWIAEVDRIMASGS